MGEAEERGGGTAADRMKVLFAVPYPPLATKPRPHHFIRGLAARGHDVHLLLEASSHDEIEALDGDPSWHEVRAAAASIDWVVIPRMESWRRCLFSLPTRTPLRVAYCSSPSLRREAERLVDRYQIDVLHADRERMAPAFAALAVPKVLDATDSIRLYLRRLIKHGHLADRVLSSVEILKIPSFEKRMARGYQACLVTSAEDADDLVANGSAVEPTVVPNGVSDELLALVRDPVPGRVVFIGNLHYPPNVDALSWFVKKIWPRIRTEVSDARFSIVGNKPSRSVVSLGATPGVEVTGWVPAIAPVLARASVFVAPMRIGGGFPNKVAEALAAGSPTVATAAGHNGIGGLEPGVHLLQADDPRGFARAVVDLLRDGERAQRIGDAGRSVMSSRYRWDEIAARLESIYQGVSKDSFANLGPR